MLSVILTQTKALVINIYRVASCLSSWYAMKYSVFQSQESVGRSASITYPPVLTLLPLLVFPFALLNLYPVFTELPVFSPSPEHLLSSA